VYLADGGGGGTASASPQFTGTQRLHIEASAIPEALKAFRAAYESVNRKVQDLRGLQIKDWAGDPVSSETAVQFHERSNGGGSDSAVECLTGYQKQLKAAVDSLQAAHDSYVRTEGDNSALWGKHHQA
jgi:hypothetical protein